MNRIVHFEIHADDVERAAKFYTEALGWDIQKWQSPNAQKEGGGMEYWMVMTAPKGSKEMGISGGLLKRPQKLAEGMCGSNAFVCTALVENYDETVKKILAAGGKEAMPKFKIEGGEWSAWQGYFIDTEGNTFGVHQVIDMKPMQG